MSFEGTSGGDIHKALAEAIKAAKAGLHAQRVTWRLEEVRGEHGGLAADHVTVRIHAEAADVA